MLFYNKQFAASRERYEELFREEKNPSISTIVPLAWIYLKFAETEKATKLLELLVKQNPDSIEAKQYLSEVYYETEKPYLALLLKRQIYSLSPMPELLHRLSARYHSYENYQAQIWALQELVNQNQASENEYYQLIYLYALQNRTQNALEAINNLIYIYKEKILEQDTIDLVISILGDNRQKEEAYQFALRQFKIDPKLNKALGIAYAMMDHGMIDLSLSFLDQLPQKSIENELVNAARVTAYLKKQDNNTAYALLRKYLVTSNFPLDHAEVFFDIALERNSLEVIDQILSKIPLTNVSEETYYAILEQAILLKNIHTIHEVKKNLGTFYLNNHPFQNYILNIALSTSLKDSFPTNDNFQKSILVKFYMLKGYDPAAKTELESFTSLERIPEHELYPLASLYVKFGLVQKGLELFQNLKEKQTSLAIENGWLLLASAQGNTDEVLKVLKSKPDLSEQFIYDLYYTASDHHNSLLASEIAHILVQHSYSLKNKKLWAEALAASGQEEKALSIYRELYLNDKSLIDDYLSVLAEVAKKQSKYNEELHELILTRLQVAPLPIKRKRELGYILIDHEFKEDATKIFFKLANKKPFKHPDTQTLLGLWGEHPSEEGISWMIARAEKAPEKEKSRWIQQLIDVGASEKAIALFQKEDLKNKKMHQLYVKALDAIIFPLVEDSDKRAELKKWVDIALQVKPLSKKKLRELGFVLLNADFKNESISVFILLANKRPYKHKDVQTLLSIWGEKPDESGLNWIVTRTKASKGNEKGFWLKHLLDINQSSRLIALVNEEEYSFDSILDVYLDALQNLKMKAKLTEILCHMLSVENRPERIKKFAKLAQSEDQQDLALKGFHKLLTMRPNDSDALKELGTLYFGKGNLTLSQYYLVLYHCQKPEGDYLSHYYLGEISHHKKLKTEAKYHYLFSLCLIEKLEKKDLSIHLMIANIFTKMDYYNLAIHLYSKLLIDNPENLAVRANFANLLMDNEKWDEASSVLSFVCRPSKHEKEEDKDDKISYAIALLRLLKENLCICTGLEISKQLIEDYLDSPMVWEAGAVWQEWLGRWRRALCYLETARKLNPLNESYSEAIKNILLPHQDYLAIEGEYRRTALTQKERFARAEARAFISESTQVLCGVETDYLRVTAFTDLQGITRPFHGWISRGEFNFIEHFYNGTIAKETVFIGDNILGAGLGCTVPTYEGLWGIKAEYHKPCWDFVQTTIQQGTIDRIEVLHKPRLPHYWYAYSAASLNRYNLQGLSNAASSWSLEGILSYQFSTVDCMAKLFGKDFERLLFYSLDAEYGLHDVEKIGSTGLPFFPIPFSSRENHSVYVLLRKNFPSEIILEGYGGYLYDRMAGGPMVPIYGASLLIGKLGDLQLLLKYTHTVSTESGGGVVDSYLFNFKRPF